jgi:hypothetical protein
MQSLQRAHSILGPLARDHPDDSDNPRYLSIAHLGLGKVHAALGQPAEALKDWQATVGLIESHREPTPFDLYKLAGAYALSSTVIEKVRARSRPGNEPASRELLGKAMDALRRAVDAGWSDARQMETDDDLKPLRSREDFRALLIKIRKK